MRLAFVALSLMLATACDFGLQSGCDFRTATLASPEPRCQDRSGLSSAAFGAMCDGLGGETVKGGCDTTDAIVGCDIGSQGDGTKVIDWYYDPKTRAEAETDCADDGGEIVEP